jgi:hypothetical protein
MTSIRRTGLGHARPVPDGGIINVPAIDRAAGHLAAGDRHDGKARASTRPGGDQGRRPDRLHRPRPAGHQDANFALRPARLSGGISAAAASIFFAYVGFDAVSTAAEETKNPQRNMPIGLIGSLAICTVFYLLVARVIGRRRRPAGARR